MTTTRLIGIIAIGVLLLILFSFLPVSENPEDQSAQVAGSFSPEIGSDNLADFIGRDGTYACTTSYEDGEIASYGTVYVSGNRFRADFESTIASLGTIIDTHSIWDGERVWSWSSASGVGTTAIASVENIISESGSENNGGYTCLETMLDEALFIIPDGVTFEQL